MLDKETGTGTVEIEIDLKSIDFGQDALNKWAIGPDFFDTAKYPKAIYKGKLTGFGASGTPNVTGDLTLHGVTNPISLDAHDDGKRWNAKVVLDQRKFGIKPFSAMFGALKIKPDVEVNISMPHP